jgi:molybdopterin biosynthesis enzyme
MTDDLEHVLHTVESATARVLDLIVTSGSFSTESSKTSG